MNVLIFRMNETCLLPGKCTITGKAQVLLTHFPATEDLRQMGCLKSTVIQSEAKNLPIKA